MSEPDTQIEHTATILFADVCGSTPLFEETGNWTAFEVIGSALDRHTDIIRDCGGVVIRSKGRPTVHLRRGGRCHAGRDQDVAGTT